jgi:S-adenosylmethionine hydrolase
MITLFTDFGLLGPYTGQMKAVLAREAPGIAVIDLFADAPAQNPKAGAYLLPPYVGGFPPGSVCLAVVDPGVGSPRRALAVEADGRWYVGPDNGLFEIVLRRAPHARVFEIVWRPEVLSASFHGRDLFAPIAARLARGAGLGETAQPAVATRFNDWPDDLAEIVYIDGYGNALTGLRKSSADAACAIEITGCRLHHAHTFSDLPKGEAFWYVNSNGLIEIAANCARADERLGLGIGTPLTVCD